MQLKRKSPLMINPSQGKYFTVSNPKVSLFKKTNNQTKQTKTDIFFLPSFWFCFWWGWRNTKTVHWLNINWTVNNPQNRRRNFINRENLAQTYASVKSGIVANNKMERNLWVPFTGAALSQETSQLLCTSDALFFLFHYFIFKIHLAALKGYFCIFNVSCI